MLRPISVFFPPFFSPRYSQGMDYNDDPFLAAMAQREEPNRDGKMTTIIFIRDKNSKGQEISGYIDLAHRLKVRQS